MTITPIKTIDFSTPFWQGKYILIDSRKLLFPAQSIFFALKGNLTNGHAFIPNLYQQGLRAFVISQSIDQSLYPEATFVLVDNVVVTMQAYAQYHRSQFDIPIIAITGSNGKTILKEWLSLLLEQDFVLVKSPKSYNSQIGVPMSIMSINARHELGIFEAGISQVGEMKYLAKVIQPNIGIFTNIGKAHASGFESLTQKIQEKLQLFEHCKTLIYRIDHTAIHEIIQQQQTATQCWSWGASEKATLPIYTQTLPQSTLVRIHWQGKIHELSIPFTNAAAIENCLHGIATLIYLGIPIQDFSQRIAKLQDVPMRLEIKEGINNCHIVDDSYNNDLEGLKIALDFLNQKHKNSSAYTKTLILSDIPEAKQFQLYPTVAQLIQKYNIQKFIGIGEDLQQHANLFHALPQVHFFKNTSAFIQQIGKNIHFHQESILLKGARSFEFERIAQQLKKRIHGTTLEINLSHVLHNLQQYKNQLHPNTKLMVMVKASAYGSGAYEIAQLLQYKQIDYLGVAYVDEGIALRQRGIQLPIMVMNTAAHEFELLCQHHLEPVVYSFSILEEFTKFLQQTTLDAPYPIHLEFDTGMHRLGFVPNELAQLLEQLSIAQTQLYIKGIFSHLAASDEQQYEAFTQHQIETFQQVATEIESQLGIKSIKHILNSAGISRFPQHQLDMVRLGIGLYGFDPNKKLPNLQNVAQLKTSIAQIKTIPAGETVGYSRNGKIQQSSRIAVLSIGYADGFSRVFGNGKAKVKINHQWATTVGNICMDMCFVDVSHIPSAQVGDEVIIFDSIAMVENLAEIAQTIPYEILTNISDRVPRIFYEE